MSSGEPLDSTIPLPHQEPANQTCGKGKRVAQSLPNIPKKKQASTPDEATSMPAAAITDLMGACRPIPDEDLRDLYNLIGRRLNARETELNDVDDDEQLGDPGPANPSLAPSASTRRVPATIRLQELFPRLLDNPKLHRPSGLCRTSWRKGLQPHPLLCCWVLRCVRAPRKVRSQITSPHGLTSSSITHSSSNINVCIKLRLSFLLQ